MTTKSPKERATEWNRRLAVDVRRWLLTRLALAALFIAGASLLAVFKQYAFVFPCAGAAACFGILALDAFDQLREIRSRRWERLTPFHRDSKHASKRAELTPSEWEKA